MDFIPVRIFCCKIDLILISFDYILFYHLVWRAMDDEYTSTNGGCCNAMFELNNKSCDVGEFAVGILALNAIDKKLYISDFI